MKRGARLNSDGCDASDNGDKMEMMTIVITRVRYSEV